MNWCDPIVLVVWSQLTSCFCSLIHFVWRPNHPSTWVNNNLRIKRYAYRLSLFVACWLFPFSIYFIAFGAALRIFALDETFLALPVATRILAILVPSILLQVLLFRYVLRYSIAKASVSSEA